MKKLVCILLSVMAVITFTACGSPVDSDLSKEIAELRQTIINLQQQLNINEGKTNTMQTQVEEQERLIELYKKQIENLSGIPIEYTAKKPIFEEPDTDDLVVSFSVYDYDNEAFDEFIKYYNEEFKPLFDYDFYLINPGKEVLTPWFRHKRISNYKVFAADKETMAEPIIHEYITYYDEVLGDADSFYNQGYDGGYRCSAIMSIYLAPMPKPTRFVEESSYFMGISTEFGIVTDDEGGIQKYFNIYFENTCIGTCYYSEHSYISRTWFDKFLREKHFLRNTK